MDYVERLLSEIIKRGSNAEIEKIVDDIEKEIIEHLTNENISVKY